VSDVALTFVFQLCLVHCSFCSFVVFLWIIAIIETGICSHGMSEGLIQLGSGMLLATKFCTPTVIFFVYQRQKEEL